MHANMVKFRHQQFDIIRKVGQSLDNHWVHYKLMNQELEWMSICISCSLRKKHLQASTKGTEPINMYMSFLSFSMRLLPVKRSWCEHQWI